MKHLMMTMAFIALAMPLFAQNENNPFPLKKGTSFVGHDFVNFNAVFDGALTLNSGHQLSYGKFIANRIALGTGIKVYYGKDKLPTEILSTNIYQFALASFGRFYLMKTNGVFLEGNIEVGFSAIEPPNKDSYKKFDHDLGISGGYTIMIGKNKKWAFEPKFTMLAHDPFDSNKKEGYLETDGISFGAKYFFSKKNS